MKLYEALKYYEGLSLDTTDTEYDCIVTIDKIEEVKDNYDLFCVELQKKVELKKFIKGYFATAVVDWTGFLKKNKDQFVQYVKENWIESKQYVLNDEDEFFCEWIEQINLLVAGNGTETIYKNFINMLKECK